MDSVENESNLPRIRFTGFTNKDLKKWSIESAKSPDRKQMLPAEVFLSHSNVDREMASRVADVLRAHGVPVWFSQANIIGGQQWHDEIGAALARCDWFVVLLSPEAVSSKWVKRELGHALRNDRYNDRIVPIRYRDCDPDQLSWTLTGFQMVDFSGDFEAGCRDLLRIWGIGLRT